jgi:hypothetical protein
MDVLDRYQNKSRTTLANCLEMVSREKQVSTDLIVNILASPRVTSTLMLSSRDDKHFEQRKKFYLDLAPSSILVEPFKSKYIRDMEKITNLSYLDLLEKLSFINRKEHLEKTFLDPIIKYIDRLRVAQNFKQIVEKNKDLAKFDLFDSTQDLTKRELLLIFSVSILLNKMTQIQDDQDKNKYYLKFAETNVMLAKKNNVDERQIERDVLTGFVHKLSKQSTKSQRKVIELAFSDASLDAVYGQYTWF